jgi:hypothetical protein
MVRKIALGLFALIALACIALFAVASTRPDSYHVERSAVLAATPATVHAVLDDMHRFNDWSPWQKLDPAMKVDYTGPATGVGASLHWVGDSDVGEGRMTITESMPPSSVSQKLEFIKPFAAVCDVRLTVAPEGEGSKVTWAIDGKADFMTKLMSLFQSMDSMMGKDFEEGLSNLDRITASAPAPAAADSTTTS